MPLKIVERTQVKVRKNVSWTIKKFSNGGFSFEGPSRKLYLAPRATRAEKKGVLKALPQKVRDRWIKKYPKVAQKLM